MAELGLCSRREADDWIAKGWVRVDGAVAPMGLQVGPTPASRSTRKRARPAARAGHHPAAQADGLRQRPGRGRLRAGGGAGAAAQPLGRRSVAPHRFAPRSCAGWRRPGRLDIDSTGLLVLTQDGRVARQLIGEDSGMEKEYLVRVEFGAWCATCRPLSAGAAGALAARPEPGRQAAEAGAGGLAEPRAAALRAGRRQEAPDPPHVRAGGPAVVG
jgi:hypothetical protein